MTNAEIVRAIYQGVNQKDLDGILALVDDSFAGIDCARGVQFQGKAGFRQDIQEWLTAFPDGQVQITNLVEAGDTVIVELMGRGTHRGPLGKGPMTIPATGRRGELAMCELFTLRNGKVVAMREYYDVLTILRQIGAIQMPQPEAGQRPEARPH